MTIEWKQSLGEMKQIIESTAAFANTEGGRIFIGVSNKGEVLGVQIGKDCRGACQESYDFRARISGVDWYIPS